MTDAMSYGSESRFINVNWDAWVAIGTIALAAVTVFISFRSESKIDFRLN